MHFVIIKLFAHFHNYMLNKEILKEHLALLWRIIFYNHNHIQTYYKKAS